MKCEWHRISDYVSSGEIEIRTGPFGTQLRASDYVASGIPVINVRNIGYGTINEEKLEYIDEQTAMRLSMHLLRTNDIVFGRKGAVDRHAFIVEKYNGWLQGSDCIRLRVNTKKLLPQYLSYYFLTKRHKGFMESMCSHGSTMASLNQKILEKIEFPYVSVENQMKIVEVLSAIDRKVMVNRNINANLQQQAQAIFKSWFVDFEPFQDGEFVESELGPIPKGWSVGRLADICTYGKDKVAVSELTPENYFSTENMLANKGGYTSAASLPNVLQTARCVPGDTLVSNIRPYFKKIVYCMMNAGCSTDVLCLRPKHSKYNTYLYNLGYSDAFFDYMVAGSKGTKMPRGDKQQIMSYPVILPPDEVIAQFHEFADAVLKKIWVALEESKKLTVLRDGLLQKLMSGELNLSDI